MTDTVGNTRKLNARQAILLGIAAALSILLLLDSVVFTGNLEAFWAVLHGQQLHAVEASSASTADAVTELAGIGIALIALACAAGAGRREAGLAWGSAPRQTKLLGEWMLVIGIMSTVYWLVIIQVVAMTNGAGAGNNNLNRDEVQVWFLLLKFVNAGITEEIIIMAVVWRLLELIPTRAGRSVFVMTGAATAILIALRASYHLHQGILVVYVIAFGWLTVRFYRHTRSLGTLIVAHILWNILGPPITVIPAEALFVAVGCLLAFVFTTGPALFGPHFGFAFGRERENPTGDLPYRFIWQTPKTPAPSDPPSSPPFRSALESTVTDLPRQDSDL